MAYLWRSLLCTAALLSACTSDDHKRTSTAEELVKERLKDPQSAIFTEEILFKKGDRYILCGQVNSKNSYGGYAGATRFMAPAEPGYSDAAVEVGLKTAERMNVHIEGGGEVVEAAIFESLWATDCK